MAIVGIALLILISGTVIFLDYSRTSNDEIISSQLDIVGNSIMNNAEAMYVLGNESWITIEFSVPTNVMYAAINNNRDLYFRYTSSGGTSDVVFFSDKFNISSENPSACSSFCYLNITPGVNRMKIRSLGDVVVISKDS
ncbi:MAG: hypothetical protein ACP5N3_04620 [Candidatus Nanoarchaeia archaeon]